MGKVAMIECSLSDALLIHGSTYHRMNHQCNFIFVSPPSSEELEKRLIRDVERMETTGSIRNKKHQMDLDMSRSNGIGFIDKKFVCANDTQLLKEAPLYIMHELYKFHASE